MYDRPHEPHCHLEAAKSSGGCVIVWTTQKHKVHRNTQTPVKRWVAAPLFILTTRHQSRNQQNFSWYEALKDKTSSEPQPQMNKAVSLPSNGMRAQKYCYCELQKFKLYLEKWSLKMPLSSTADSGDITKAGPPGLSHFPRVLSVGIKPTLRHSLFFCWISSLLASSLVFPLDYASISGLR